MMLATFDNVVVEVDGLPEGTTVSLGVGDEGLMVHGFGMLSWTGSHVSVEDLAPRGVRVRLTPPAGAMSLFYIPGSSIPDKLPLNFLAGSLERLAAGGGALVEGALTAA